jgi:hypothetical protein
MIDSNSVIEIFVFGSNLAGRHGAGSALHAKRHHGAIQGQGVGFQGSSYAIPTKDSKLVTLPLDQIEPHVKAFISFATEHPELKFNIVRIGCGLAGYTDKEMAPMFKDCPSNCILPKEWYFIK